MYADNVEINRPAANQAVSPQALAQADSYGEGPSSHASGSKGITQPFMEDTSDGFQQAMNARVVETI